MSSAENGRPNGRLGRKLGPRYTPEVVAMTEHTTIRARLQAIEAYAGRRATVRPYMSPEERLARIEEHAEFALELLDQAQTYGPVEAHSYPPMAASPRCRLVPDPVSSSVAPRGGD